MTGIGDGGQMSEPVDAGAVLDVLVARIEKLWRKANDPAATPAERHAFEAKALSLMQRHRIEAAMLNLEADDPLGDVRFGMVEGRYARVQIDVVSSVAEAYGCRVWWMDAAFRKELFVFGFTTDCARVVRIARLLISDAMAEAGKLHRRSPATTFSARAAFVQGYATAVGDRFREAARLAAGSFDDAGGEVAAGSGSAALVLVGRAETVRRAYSARKFSTARQSSRPGDGEAFAAGRSAGMQASTSVSAKRVGVRRELSA
jgi:hypothetical protein